MRILLVEDDESSAKVLQSVLTEARYAVDVAFDGQTGWQLLSASDYDLILLDVVLPNINGLDFCRQLRDNAFDAPVLLVTSLDSSQEKVAGLNAGADDYLTKPFEVEELLARVRALLRRVKTAVVSTLRWGDLCLQPNSREVTYGSYELALTPKEYALLELFLRNPAQVFSRGAILDRLWRYSDAPGEETVTSHVKGLRKKLSDAGAPEDLVQTVYGVGYRLKPSTEVDEQAGADKNLSDKDLSDKSLPNKSLPNKKLPEPPIERMPEPLGETSTEKLTADYQQKIQIAIATLWQSAKYKQLSLLERLAQAEVTLRSRQLSNEEQRDVYMTAHRMHGALGLFGFLEGSYIAAEIQKLFKDRVSLSASEKARLKVLVKSLADSIR